MRHATPRPATRFSARAVHHGKPVRFPAPALLLAAALAGCAVFSPSAGRHPGVTLYVSPAGDDAWSGRAPSRTRTDGPFRTLTAARDAIRVLRAQGPLPAGGVTVEFQPGTYEMVAKVEFTEADSGTPDAPITYRAKPGAQVRFVGGRVIPRWTPVSDPESVKRLAPGAAGHVVRADLRALGVTEYGKPSGGWSSPSGDNAELFFNDRPMRIARWPNGGFVRIADVTPDKPVDVRGTKGSKAPAFHYDPEALGSRPQRWQSESDLWAHGWWFWDWAEERHPVAAIDTERRLITLREPPVHSYGYRKGQWWYVFNALCELDEPGEYYIDRANGALYFWPPAPAETAQASISVTRTLIAMSNTSHVTWRGILFETARDTPITLAGGAGNRIVGCVLRNCGGYAVSILGGRDNGVAGCDIYETGAGGVILEGGDRKTLTPASNFVDNCHIHHYSRWNRILKPAVNLSGCGNRITHNLIDNAPHKAILFSGNDHLIEYNEIHSVVYEANDAGAIYGGYNWTMRGNVIRYNYFHHIQGFEGRGCMGIYLDDMFSSATIHHNLFHKVCRAAFIGGGRDTVVSNNLFVACNPAVHVDARGLGWASGAYDTLAKRLNEMPFRTEPWRSRYPQLLTLLEDEPMTPKGNLITGNLCAGGVWDGIHAKARPHVTVTNNLITADPYFADAARQDFRLRPDSPAYAMGFTDIPVERIGVYASPLRASWPVRSEIRPLPERKP
ncbi:MAG: right-handed parallel beta-helix repeat-containing protein [Kiritimatiellia bacterium]|jgi:hypothetical protein|nr:right-handed parallel beta-helix repeat-containing protein [Kiritimatiellia bacterium]